MTVGPGMVDLAARRLSGLVLAASDDYFAPKEALLRPDPPVFQPEAFTDRGKLMDGWESRRRRTPGEDWCLIRLGVPGAIREVVVDTTHFKGNAPAACAVDAVATDDVGGATTDASVADLLQRGDWEPVLSLTDIHADTQNRLPVAAPVRATHVRLRIHPDGGVARLRVLGDPLPHLPGLADPAGRLELASSTSGGTVTACSDAFFSAPDSLLAPGDAVGMWDGWETRRRRGPGHDWVVVRLATEATVDRVTLSTLHFTGNYPDRAAVDAVHAPGLPGTGGLGAGDVDALDWTEVITPQPLAAHAWHRFAVDHPEPVTHLRLRLLPDGGAARLRVDGQPTAEGWAQHGVRRLDTALDAAAQRALAGCCAASRWIEGMASRRPFGDAATLRAAADHVWAALGPDDWREAFEAHPRIGDRPSAGRAATEQRGVADADAEVLSRLAEGNRAYEQRFGHVFLIRAAGRSADEMLATLEQRLGNDPDTELTIAAEQQRQIMQLRLAALVSAPQEVVS